MAVSRQCTITIDVSNRFLVKNGAKNLRSLGINFQRTFGSLKNLTPNNVRLVLTFLSTLICFHFFIIFDQVHLSALA